MSNTKNHSIKEIEFRGVKVKINLMAAKSMKVQRALALMDKDVQRGYWALDKMLCDGLDDVLDRIPEEDGTVSELGASDDAFAAFLEVVAKELAAKK